MGEPVRTAHAVRRGPCPVLAALVLALLASGCAPSPEAARTPPAGARVVAGGDGGGLARAEPDSEQIDAAPLDSAWQSARQQGARALLVMRHGHLVFERYRSSADASARIDGGAMSATVLALLAGIAQGERSDPLTEGTAVDAPALQAAVQRAAQGPFEAYLSRQLWRPLDADTAWYMPAPDGSQRPDCCLHARASDWLRIGQLLLDQGRDRGEQRVPARWVAAMLRPSAVDPTRGIAVRLAPRGHAVRNLVWLPGAQGSRLWLAPSLQLAVLRIDSAAADSPAERDAEWLDPLLRAVRDRGQSTDAGDLLDQLVPGH